jgi:hypothetical protein
MAKIRIYKRNSTFVELSNLVEELSNIGLTKTSDDNSVTSAKIVDGEVKSVDIGDGEVKSPDIGDGQVGSVDIASGAIQIEVHKVIGPPGTTPPSSFGVKRVDCPPGEILTGGGFTKSVNMEIIDSLPEDANTWFAQAFNTSTTSEGHITPFALCIDPTKP